MALYCIVWAVVAAVAVWGVTTARSCAAISRLRAEMRQEIAYWQAETARARTLAAQTARDAATRARLATASRPAPPRCPTPNTPSATTPPVRRGPGRRSRSRTPWPSWTR